MWRVLKLAARAAVWRTTPDPPLVGLPVLLGFAVAVAVVRIALQLLAAGSWRTFNPYGLNAVVAWIALELAVAALFVRPAGRASALSAMFVLSIVADIATTAIKLGFTLPVPPAAQSALWIGALTTDAIYAVAVVWWVGAMVCVVGSLEWQTRLPLIGKVVALWAALFVANALVPHAPVFLPLNFDARNANWWEALYALHRDKNGDARATSAEFARIEQAQPALLQSEIARLAPQRKGAIDIYALGVAGWADQNVFGKELDGGLEFDRERAAHQGSDNPPDQSSRHGRHLSAGEFAKFPGGGACHRRCHGQGKRCSRPVSDVARRKDRFCAGIAGRHGRADAATGRRYA